ncbi:MAG: hypothetical protein KDA86_03570 [Planctomycetaceae bacterium]|nr:hypothetical protein [Planctomycetaceae bacterium]
MPHRLPLFSTIALSLFTATLFAEEPAISPEIDPPLLPAPSVTAAPEFVPPGSAGTYSVPHVSPPEMVTPPSVSIAPPAVAYQPVALYPRVRVRSKHKAHPYGVPTIVAVADPRDRSCLVNVEVCMPPCECLGVFHNRRGNRVTYDFGQYEIEIISRLGVVIVDYNS